MRSRAFSRRSTCSSVRSSLVKAGRRRRWIAATHSCTISQYTDVPRNFGDGPIRGLD